MEGLRGRWNSKPFQTEDELADLAAELTSELPTDDPMREVVEQLLRRGHDVSGDVEERGKAGTGWD